MDNEMSFLICNKAKKSHKPTTQMTNGKEGKNQFCIYILTDEMNEEFMSLLRGRCEKKNEPLPFSSSTRSFYISWNGCFLLIFCGFCNFHMDEWMYSLASGGEGKGNPRNKQCYQKSVCGKNCFSFSVMAQFFSSFKLFIVHIIIVWKHLSKIDGMWEWEKNHKNEERVDSTMITTTLEGKIAMIHPQIFFSRMSSEIFFIFVVSVKIYRFCKN